MSQTQLHTFVLEHILPQKQPQHFADAQKDSQQREDAPQQLRTLEINLDGTMCNYILDRWEHYRTVNMPFFLQSIHVAY